MNNTLKTFVVLFDFLISGVVIRGNVVDSSSNLISSDNIFIKDSFDETSFDGNGQSLYNKTIDDVE